MGFLEKKITLFKKKDAATWKQIREALKDAGITGVKAGSYFADPVAACGCGGHLDPRNYGPKGSVDRYIYYIEVPESQKESALAALSERGITPEVDEQAAVDAAKRLRK